MWSKIADGLTSAVALIVIAVAMVVLSWGWANNWIAYSWIAVIVAVLLSELGNKLFSPDKRTWSSNVRTEVKKGGWRIWTMLIVWLYFSVTLFLHFIKPIWLGS